MGTTPESSRIGKATRVAVVFGGRSTEHAISCVSAASVMAALEKSGYEVVPIGITAEGRWVLMSGGTESLEIRDRKLPAITDGTEVILSADPSSHGLVRVESEGKLKAFEPTEGASRLSGVDVVFPVLHGAYGEDGTLQGLLEMAGLPYVGAGVLSSAVCMDKEYTKRLLAAADIPVVPYEVLRPGQQPGPGIIERLGFPLFVKPARAGSSVGITKVREAADLEDAIATAREVDPKLILESGIVGREIECGVLESETPGGDPDTSLPAEIRVIAGERDWYDFEAKYLDDVCEFDIPATLTPERTAEVRALAARAFTALDGAGLARVDFFVTDDTIYVNELNTMPGFTQISLFPRVWEEAGIAYPALVARLVETAKRRGTGLR